MVWQLFHMGWPWDAPCEKAGLADWPPSRGVDGKTPKAFGFQISGPVVQGSTMLAVGFNGVPQTILAYTFTKRAKMVHCLIGIPSLSSYVVFCLCVCVWLDF